MHGRGTLGSSIRRAGRRGEVELKIEGPIRAVFLTSRSAATAACRAGHVCVNRIAAKASTQVKVGDRIEAVMERPRLLEVVTVIDKRVGAAVAATCLVDHSPPAPKREPPVFRRERGAGRPTKRERRGLDRLRRG